MTHYGNETDSIMSQIICIAGSASPDSQVELFTTLLSESGSQFYLDGPDHKLRKLFLRLARRGSFLCFSALVENMPPEISCSPYAIEVLTCMPCCIVVRLIFQLAECNQISLFILVFSADLHILSRICSDV